MSCLFTPRRLRRSMLAAGSMIVPAEVGRPLPSPLAGRAIDLPRQRLLRLSKLSPLPCVGGPGQRQPCYYVRRSYIIRPGCRTGIYAKNDGGCFQPQIHGLVCPKYRRPVLIERRQNAPVESILLSAALLRHERSCARNADHVGVFIETDSRRAPAQFVGKIKANASLVLRVEFPHFSFAPAEGCGADPSKPCLRRRWTRSEYRQGGGIHPCGRKCGDAVASSRKIRERQDRRGHWLELSSRRLLLPAR